MRETSSRLNIPDFSRTGFGLFKWKEVLSRGPFQRTARTGVLPKEGESGATGVPALARQGAVLLQQGTV